MSKFKNIKIEINEDQPIDEIVRELEGLGYVQDFSSEYPKSVETYSDGTFDCYCFKQNADTNLTELKNTE